MYIYIFITAITSGKKSLLKEFSFHYENFGSYIEMFKKTQFTLMLKIFLHSLLCLNQSMLFHHFVSRACY